MAFLPIPIPIPMTTPLPRPLPLPPPVSASPVVVFRTRPFACTPASPRPRGVPINAAAASHLLRASTRAALSRGLRGLLVDVLVEAVRRDSRTFDPAAHAALLQGLVSALSPALTPSAPRVRVLLSGARAALDASRALRDGVGSDGGDGRVGVGVDVDVDVLGAGAVRAEHGAVLVVQPRRGVEEDVREVRRVAREARRAGSVVMVLNQPQQGSVYAIGSCEGELPLELLQYETVFVLAPFALRVKERGEVGQEMEAESAPARLGRFVLLRTFPDLWELWRRVEEGESGETPETVAELLSLSSGGGERYAQCGEWAQRPGDAALLDAVGKATREAK